jgi:hypothetical protein
MEKESKMRVDGSLQTREAIRLIIKKNTQMEAKLTLPTNSQGKMGGTEGVYFEQNKPI